jgi:hypothetical protein
VVRTRRIHDQVDERLWRESGQRPLVPGRARVLADEQTGVGGVEAVDEVSLRAKDVEVGLAEQGHRRPGLASVARLDQPQQGR